MLNVMRRAVLEPVQGLTVAQLDYLHDAKANTIGALLHHLAAIERLYQIRLGLRGIEFSPRVAVQIFAWVGELGFLFAG